jgi:hypothetical protein
MVIEDRRSGGAAERGLPPNGDSYFSELSRPIFHDRAEK